VRVFWPADSTTAETNASYQRAFMDFFEDEMVGYGYDWKALVRRYLLDNSSPLQDLAMAGGMLIDVFCQYFTLPIA
jgi:Questin oxidase-like